MIKFVLNYSHSQGRETSLLRHENAERQINTDIAIYLEDITMKEYKKFYVCEHCGNVVEKVNDAGVPVVCCGQKMSELVPGTVEASREKHLPAVSVEENIVHVSVGSVEHPMVEEHSILWVYLQTDKGGQMKYLAVGESPVVDFALAGEKPVAVFAYCNLHGLWRTDLE